MALSGRTSQAAQVADVVSAETHSSAATVNERISDLGAVPTLPNAASSARADLPGSAALSDFMARTADGTGALMWNALATMARDSSNDTKDASDARVAFQKGKADAKTGQIKAQERENAAGRDDAGMQLGFSTAARGECRWSRRATKTRRRVSRARLSLAVAQAAPENSRLSGWPIRQQNRGPAGTRQSGEAFKEYARPDDGDDG